MVAGWWPSPPRAGSAARSTCAIWRRTTVPGPVVEGDDALFGNAILTADQIYLLTNADAPNYRDRRDRSDRSSPPGRRVADRRRRAGLTASSRASSSPQERIVTHELEARHVATARLRSSGRARPANWPCPALGSVGGLDAEESGTVVVAGFSSFAVAPRLITFDLVTGQGTPLASQPLAAGLDPERIAVEQVVVPVARTARRSRCSSSIAHGSPRTATTRRC